MGGEMESLQGEWHNILLMNLNTGRGQNTLWFAGWVATKWKRQSAIMTHWNLQLKGLDRKRKSEESGMQVIPDQEWASNSVFSSMAVRLGHWLLGERRGQSPEVSKYLWDNHLWSFFTGEAKMWLEMWTHGCSEKEWQKLDSQKSFRTSSILSQYHLPNI